MLTVGMCAPFYVTGCTSPGESYVNAVFESLVVPKEADIRPHSFDGHQKSWDVLRRTPPIGASDFVLPAGCSEDETSRRDRNVLTAACPDPGRSGALCLVDINPTNDSKGVNDGRGVEVSIACGLGRTYRVGGST